MKVDVNNFLSHHIKNNIPTAIGKIGTSELSILANYIISPNEIIPSIKELAEINAGIYPLTIDNLKRFYDLYIESLKCLNIAPRWNISFNSLEKDILEKHTTSYDANLIDFEPQWFDKPWTKYLKDKTVLVISPFNKSIQEQYKKRNLIWPNSLLPNFNLITINHPHARQSTNFFDVLEQIKTEILKYDFDICIIGTGGTSIPLTSYVRNMNKIAIHLGGATQILFGIKGKRWDERIEYQRLYNEYWKRPDLIETPVHNKQIEEGCYW